MDDCIGAAHPFGHRTDVRQIVRDELDTETRKIRGRAARIADRGDNLIAASAERPDDRPTHEPGSP
jgi:hypothetical protein